MTPPERPVPRVYWFLASHLVLCTASLAGAIATNRGAIAALYLPFLLLSPGLFALWDGGWKAVGELYKRCISWKHSGMLWAATLLVPMTILVPMVLYAVVMKPEKVAFGLTMHLGLAGVLFAVWMEEVAWRGYATPKLLERHSPVAASVILSVFWSFWHLPNFFAEFYSPAGPVAWFALIPVYSVFTFFTTWLGLKTGHSILLPTVAHFMMNWVVGWYQPYWMEYVATIGSGILLGAVVLVLFKKLNNQGGQPADLTPPPATATPWSRP